jgi:hypothetical protein
MLWERIRDVVPRRLGARPEVALWFHVWVIIQRAGSHKDHPWPVLSTREHMTSAGLAEATLFPGGRLIGKERFFPNDFESFGFRDQYGGEC